MVGPPGSRSLVAIEMPPYVGILNVAISRLDLPPLHMDGQGHL